MQQNSWHSDTGDVNMLAEIKSFVKRLLLLLAIISRFFCFELPANPRTLVQVFTQYSVCEIPLNEWSVF